MFVVVQKTKLVVLLQRIEETFVSFIGSNEKGPPLRQYFFYIAVNFLCFDACSLELKVSPAVRVVVCEKSKGNVKEVPLWKVVLVDIPNVESVKVSKLLPQCGNNPCRGSLDWILVSNMISGAQLL